MACFIQLCLPACCSSDAFVFITAVSGASFFCKMTMKPMEVMASRTRIERMTHEIAAHEPFLIRGLRIAAVFGRC